MWRVVFLGYLFNTKTNKIYLLIIGLLLIIIVSFVIGGIKYRNNQINEVVILEGENENWRLEGYKVLIYNNFVRLGDGDVIFLGDKDKVKDLKSFHIEIVKYKKNDNLEMMLYGWSLNSDSGFAITNGNMAMGNNTYDGIVKYTPEAHETNISRTDNFNFSEEYTVTMKIKIEKMNGEKFNDEIPLKVISITKDTMSDVKAKSYSK